MPVLKWLNQNAEKALASLLLAAIVLLIFGNVFMRYIMNASLSWGEELTLWLFVWFVWLGVSYAFHTGDHVRITVLRDLLGKRGQLYVDVAVGLLVLGFLAILTWECLKLIQMPFVASQKSVVLGLPIPILYASAPVGATLSAFRVIQYLKRTLHEIAALDNAKA
ncbi:TRAP transporter small permease [Palleronia caenipelagi]|uniref:TRAP transporter small permease protein n=1 Tax=Palleronia caenipelagi TaxID=2489174 RepID=A0A547Q8E0_9RHOB|nr:TRAP transporter small permease [Palleronia caenipelagi]TRD22655.1 TRAP transporter small permease [Palleronia caenipelagi]